MQSVLTRIDGLNAGYLFSLKLSIFQTQSSNSSFRHRVTSSLGFGIDTHDDTPWNLHNITLYIGGYNQSKIAGNFFEGCLSDFMFEGVNIINRYFQQYPNNTNPRRSSIIVNSFSNVAQTCDDLMSTRPPTTTIASSVTPTTRSLSMGLEPFQCYLFLALACLICLAV